jgi:hypothetical protein
MELITQRFSDGGKSTLGLLFIDGIFNGYTLEDQHRDVKVMHETRIPSGQYEIIIRTDMASTMNQRYAVKYPWFKGHLWLQDVPNFTYIYIHQGVTDEHSSGCILVGDGANNNVTDQGRLSASAKAFKRIYLKALAAIESGERVFITVKDERIVI